MNNMVIRLLAVGDGQNKKFSGYGTVHNCRGVGGGGGYSTHLQRDGSGMVRVELENIMHWRRQLS